MHCGWECKLVEPIVYCMENSMEFCAHTHTNTHTKAKYRTTIWSSNFTPGYFISFAFNGLHEHSYTSMCCIAHEHSLGEVCSVSECFGSKALVSDILLGAIKQFSKIDVLV